MINMIRSSILATEPTGCQLLQMIGNYRFGRNEESLKTWIL